MFSFFISPGSQNLCKIRPIQTLTRKVILQWLVKYWSVQFALNLVVDFRSISTVSTVIWIAKSTLIFNVKVLLDLYTPFNEKKKFSVISYLQANYRPSKSAPTKLSFFATLELKTNLELTSWQKVSAKLNVHLSQVKHSVPSLYICLSASKSDYQRSQSLTLMDRL